MGLWLIVKQELHIAHANGKGFFRFLFFFLSLLAVILLAEHFKVGGITSYIVPFIWLNALIASQYSLSYLLEHDKKDGTWSLFLLSGKPLHIIVIGKWLAYWLRSSSALILLIFLLRFAHYLPEIFTVGLVQHLMIGTAIFCCVGMMRASISIRATAYNNIASFLMLLLVAPVFLLSMPWLVGELVVLFPVSVALGCHAIRNSGGRNC